MNDIPTPGVGHNNPPRQSIADAADTFESLSSFLRSYPIIENRADAKVAAVYIDAGKTAITALEAERDGLVRPLNTTVKNINAEFKAAREPLEAVLDEAKARLTRWMDEEDARRQAELETARHQTEQAKAAAIAAEGREREAAENAAAGEFTDYGAATAEADAAFSDYERALRAEQIAARDANVRIAGGSRTLSRRTTETLEVDDPAAALGAILKLRSGALPEKLIDAMKSAARDYRKATGELPPGVRAVISKGL